MEGCRLPSRQREIARYNAGRVKLYSYSLDDMLYLISLDHALSDYCFFDSYKILLIGRTPVQWKAAKATYSPVRHPERCRVLGGCNREAVTKMTKSRRTKLHMRT